MILAILCIAVVRQLVATATKISGACALMASHGTAVMLQLRKSLEELEKSLAVMIKIKAKVERLNKPSKR